MAPARVRGCAGHRPTGDAQLTDASRRRNGPRKDIETGFTAQCLITVRLRSKSCPAGGLYGRRSRELGERWGNPRHLLQANVGSKTRSAGWVPTPIIHRLAAGFAAATSTRRSVVVQSQWEAGL